MVFRVECGICRRFIVYAVCEINNAPAANALKRCLIGFHTLTIRHTNTLKFTACHGNSLSNLIVVLEYHAEKCL